MASPSIWKTNKRLGIIICIVLISCLAVGSTLAYIVTKTDLLQNIFSPSSVEVTVSDNKVTNTGDTEAYVRVTAVVVLRSNSDPDVYYGGFTFRDGIEYDSSCTSENGWSRGSDTYFYYPTALDVGGSVSLPVISVAVASNVEIPNGYYVAVQYLVTGIQANPPEAVVEAWGGSVDSNGVYTKP